MRRAGNPACTSNISPESVGKKVGGLLSKPSLCPQLSSPKPWVTAVPGSLFSPCCSQTDQRLFSPQLGHPYCRAARESPLGGCWVIPAPLHNPQKQRGANLHSVCGPLEMPCPHPSLHDCCLPFLHSCRLFPPQGNAACTPLGSRGRGEPTYRPPSERHRWPG